MDNYHLRYLLLQSNLVVYTYEYGVIMVCRVSLSGRYT